MIEILNLDDGSKRHIEGTIMVAPNGMVFVKQGKKVVWCSAAANFEAYEV